MREARKVTGWVNIANGSTLSSLDNWIIYKQTRTAPVASQLILNPFSAALQASNITFSPQRSMNSRSTGHEAGIQTVTPQMRYTPRPTAQQTDKQTASPQRRYISLPDALNWRQAHQQVQHNHFRVSILQLQSGPKVWVTKHGVL